MVSRSDPCHLRSTQGQFLLKEATISLLSTFKLIQKSSNNCKDFLKGEIIGQRFSVLKILGRGSFGKVIKAQNMKTNQIVAIKVIQNTPNFSRHALQEIKILTEINHYEYNNGYIVKMIENFRWKENICIVFELMHKSLYQLIKETNFKGMSLANVKVFAWQILMALKFLKVPELGIIHCDMKPENIMLVSSQKAGVKLIDFGSASKLLSKSRNIQSRYYRAPEVILNHPYDFSLDIWSAGCIFTELLTGHPLFPGKSDSTQLSKIFEILGPFPTSSSSQSAYSASISSFFSQHPSNGDPNFENFLDLIGKMLNPNPNFRITAEEALTHSFFTEVKICVKETRLQSPFYQSTASSIESSPSSKGGIEVLFSPTRLGLGNEELGLRNCGEGVRRISVQENSRTLRVFSKDKE